MVVLAAGCSRNDVATLGRIGQRVMKQTDAVWNSEQNKSLLKTLPLLQPARSGSDVAPAADEPKTVPPRLSVDP